MGAIRKAAAVLLIVIAAAASAEDCVTDARVLSTRQSVPNLVAGPTAWNGSVLAVAKTQEGVSGPAWLAIYDENMNPLTADRQIAADAQSLVTLIWNGTEFGLFYRTLNQGLNLLRLDFGGSPIGPPVAITPGKLVYPGDDIDVVWSSSLNAYAVGRIISQGQSKGFWLTLVERNGAERSDRPATVTTPTRPYLDMAVTASGVIGAFFNNGLGSLVFARATGEGPITVRTMTAAGEYTEATAKDGLFFVTRSDPPGGDTTKIRWFVVDSSQQIVRPDAVLLEPSGDIAWPLSFIAYDEGLALAYLDAPQRTRVNDGSYRLRRFTANGTVISDTLFAAADFALGRAQSIYPIVWTGQSFYSAAVQSAPDRLSSYLLRYCPLRTQILLSTPTSIVRVGTPVTFTSATTGGVPSYQYGWIFPGEFLPKPGSSIAWTFDRTGTYDVTLRVTDFNGSVVFETITVTVIRPKTRAVRH
jgi:hypothetical protein